MSNTNTGGPAFPTSDLDDDGTFSPAIKMHGMTLRDYFAAKAMTQLIRVQYGAFSSLLETASVAYEYADAMLKAREA